MIISFIIPVYNCSQYLKKCIQNIIDVGLSDYEIILVDDGSTDGSSLECDKLEKEYGSVRCIHQKNEGVSSARNKGLLEANGDYILFLDCDDEIESMPLRMLIKKLEGNSNIDMAIFGLSFDYYHSGKMYRRDELKTPLAGVLSKDVWKEHFYDLYTQNSLSPIWNKIIKRELLLKNNLFLRKDMFIYEDLEYSLRILNYCDAVLFDPSIIYHYRQSEDEGNAGRRLKRINNLTDIVDRIEMAASDCSDNDVIDKILLSLYLVLAREKINVSNYEEIKEICTNFTNWYKSKNLFMDDSFIENMTKKHIVKLITHREYVRLRHKIAILVKSNSFIKSILKK